MANSSPSPSSSPSAVPPTSTTNGTLPPQPSPSLASPPNSSTPPVMSPPPVPATSPPPTTNPPPPSGASPPSTPPVTSSPPTSSPPPRSPSPPSSPPVLPPPPQASNPPSAPPPSSNPPSTSPPPSTTPPPSSSQPPQSSEPPPLPPQVPSPSTSQPPTSKPPPPSSNEPATSPPSPTSPTHHSPPPVKEPPDTSPPSISPPSPTISHLSPPPPSSQTSNPSSANPPSDNSTDGSHSNSGFPMGGGVAIGVAVGIILLGLIGVIIWCACKRKKRYSQYGGGYIKPYSHTFSLQPDLSLIVKTEASSSFVRSGSGSGALSENSHSGLGHSRSWFTYQELFEATSGFASDNLLGEGGFGSVYKGVLADGREVAVKQLRSGGEQGEREFKAEVEIISRIHHRHLVSLVGYCIFESRRLLVYDYVPNQTLHYHLHGENRPVLDWATRIKIAVGAARGIAYLHEDCHPRIIHRDIKSSNILLDAKFEARVSDFGLAKLAPELDTHVSTRVMGTFGYMAPEYAASGKLTEKSDVYSFGVVLLELISGRRPVDESQPTGEESLVEWARPLLSRALDTNQLEGLVDPKLERNYDESELLLMIEAAAACIRHSASKRPRMGQVLRAFDGLSPDDLSNGMRVGQSEIYDAVQRSEEMRWLRRVAFGNQDYSMDFFGEASRSFGYSNTNPGGRGADSTQHSRNHPSQQSSQRIYLSRHLNQNPTFSGQSSQNPDFSGRSIQNPNFSGHSSQNVDSSSRGSQSS